MRRIAFACWRSGGSTVCGTSPVDAGKKNANAAPPIAWSTTRCQISALPVSSRTAVAACDAAGHEVGGDHDEVARQPVGPDPADEQEDDLRHHPRREHEPQVRWPSR